LEKIIKKIRNLNLVGDTLTKKLFVTYCTGNKTDDKENIPAIQRYKSDRIKWVSYEAIKKKADFAILSGIFGLISPKKKIPKYDYCLQKDDVDRVKDTNKIYMQKNKIKNIVYFTELDEEVVNYYGSLKKAITELNNECEKIDQKIVLEIKILDAYKASSIKNEKFEKLIKKMK